MAEFKVTSKTSDSITVKITGLDSGFAEYRYYYWFINSVQVKMTATLPYATEASYTYTGLSANTLYYLDVRIENYQGGQLAAFSTSERTASSPVTPVTPWYWNSSELNAFNNNGNFSVLTASRWNQFCDKLNQVCIAANSSWTTTYTTLSGAKASGPGAPLTALMFMSVKFNIGSRVSTSPIPAIINTGDTVYGWYFITLQDKLNEWITYL